MRQLLGLIVHDELQVKKLRAFDTAVCDQLD